MLIVLTFSVLTSFAQTKLQKEQITSRYDKQKIQKLSADLTAKAVIEKQRAIQIARTNNWPLTIEKDGKFIELQKVTAEGMPIYYTTFNVDAAKSTRTDHLNSGGSLGLGLDGQNMTAYVWDGGIARASHQEYDGAGGSNRFSVGDGSSTLNFHAAHVTGTIIASGVQANAKGMAPHASAIGSDWNTDVAEATTAAGNGMLLSNHSYGFATRNPNTGQPWLPDHYFGGYIDESRSWDELMFNAPNYLMVVAAGNDGNDNSANGAPLNGNSSYDKLTGHSTSKNNLVIANAQDANIDANGNLVSVSISSSSSEGPTDDLRIKPDLAGNGSGVYSTYETSNTAYNSISGTSMASPNVTGTLLLLQQHANNVNGSFMRAATLKGLALHTADDAGSNGPDAVFGWGLLNAKRAAEAITQNGNESKIDELTLTSGQTYQITVDSDGVNDLMASISWTDRPGTANTVVNNPNAVLVNDLDIRVTKGGATSNPWRLTGITTNGTGDNTVDPFERVDVSNASGTYTITVTHKGSLTGGSQNYTLIVTGLTGTPVVCNATTPTSLNVDGFGSSTATISWDAVTAATYDFRYRQPGTSSWTTSAVSGTSTSLSGLTPETTYEVQVRSKCPDNSTSSYSSSVNFTTTEVQLSYCASNGNDVSDEYISNVTLGSINNTTGASSGGYGNYTSQSTNLTQGDNYTISVTPTWTGTLYNEGYSVWIDYNHDGDFADAGEQVWSQAASQATPVSGSFTIPNSTYVGNTRMRVSMQYNAIPSSCGSFNYGEVEDYTVNLGAGVADTTAPVITLNGASTINVNVGTSFTDPGATATDNVDGNLTSSIVVTGSVNTNAVGAYTLNYNVSDAAGNAATQVSRTVNVVDGTAPVITLNGSATINLTVGDSFTDPGATATDNVDGNLTSSIVVTGSVNTGAAGSYTLNYNVSDAAGNAATQVSRSVIVTEPTSGGCSGGISSFPYSEGYENTLGAWTQSSSDDINWTVDANGTPSNGTGPGSASEGSYYIFVEASGNGTGYPNKQAIINSPCYDLSGETEATFSFKYHMNGAADMGTIALEASTDNGSTWTSIWNESGDKADAWLSAEVSLNAYTGGTVQLRFNRVTGSTWQADIAIDDIQLNTGSTGGDTTVTLSLTFDNYPEETSWQILDGSTAVASGGTYGSQADGSTLNINVDLPAGCYSLVVNDVYGDGMCCSYGNGSYTLTDGGTTLASGGSFTSSETTNFCVGGATNSIPNQTTTIDNTSDHLSVYPNPVKETLNVSLLNFEAQRYEIINMLGQVVLNGSFTQTIDVSNLDEGLYILKLNIGEKSKMERFIKK
ncbi:putative surface protein [Flavobacteriales bacterium ALC-1]|nr:putative surface protein [Flavobacteriales bacterium ALC-1]